MASVTQAQAIAGLGLGGTYSVTALVNGTSVPVTGGSVSIDSAAYARRSVTLTVPESYAPMNATDLLAPYGNEVTVSVGFLPNGFSGYAPYTWQLGIFALNGFREQDDNVKSLEVYGADRADRYARTGWDDITSPITIPGSRALDAAVGQVLSYLTAVDPGLTVKPLVTSGTMPVTGTAPIVIGASMQGDPWSETVTNLVQPFGLQLYIDAYGSPTLAQSTQTSASVWTVKDGTGGTLTDFTRTGDNTGVVNYVTVDAETSYGVPFRGKAYNNVFGSATQIGGNFGYRYGHFVEPNIGSADAASARANAILNLNSLVPEYVTIGTIANPSLDVNQVITVTRGKVSRKVLINRIDIDLLAFKQTITGRVLSVGA